MTDVSLLSLFVATPAQVHVSRQRTYEHWGRGLSPEAYMRRADVLDVHEHATEGNLIIWVLAPRSDPHTLDILCACSTYRRKALVLSSSASEPEDVIAYGIASVFCPPHYRGRGYAKHLMRLLHYVLASPGLLPPFPPEWGSPPIPPSGTANARFSSLWSDVGTDFYAACGPTPNLPGWTLRDPVSTIWSVDPSFSAVIPADVQWLPEQDCLTLWETDAQYLAAQFRARESSTTCCTFLPHRGVAAFQLHFSRFFLTGIPHAPRPDTWGVQVLASGAYATYITDIRPPPLALLVTRLRASATDFPALLAALMHAACAHGAESVEVWNLDQDLLETAHAHGARTGPRDEHLPSLAWYGPEDPKEVEWLFNEKFCWC